MSTKGASGLVTIRSETGVLMKVVAGCGGQLVKDVAEALRVSWPADAIHVYEIAREAGFGCECPSKCLIVVTESGIVLGGRERSLPAVYRKTFHQPNFNPRQRDGATDFMEIIDVETGSKK